MSLIFCRILGPLFLGWAPNYFVLGAQLAPGEKRLVCISAEHSPLTYAIYASSSHLMKFVNFRIYAHTADTSKPSIVTDSHTQSSNMMTAQKKPFRLILYE